MSNNLFGQPLASHQRAIFGERALKLDAQTMLRGLSFSKKDSVHNKVIEKESERDRLVSQLL